MADPGASDPGASDPAVSVEGHWLGRTDYQATWDLQERLRLRVESGGPGAVLLCEHHPVITLGPRTTAGEVLASEAALAAAGVALLRTSRGGQATYHGPGQLVLYPIVRLHPRRGIVGHVEALAQAAVAVARQAGVAAVWQRQPVGVFVGPRKLAAIGVRVVRRVTLHGLALNVTAEAAAAFRRGLFVPCGQADGQVTSLEEAAPGPARFAVDGLAEALYLSFCAAAGHRPGPLCRHGNDSLLSALPPLK